MSVRHIQDVMRAKLAEQTGDDESHTVSGEQQTHADPPGTNPSSDGGCPETFGTGAVRESNEGRAELLRRAFTEMGSASSKDQSFINGLFDTPAGERRQAHSPLLQKKAASAEELDGLTLAERVRSVVG